jgi:hypothetical protein
MRKLKNRFPLCCIMDLIGRKIMDCLSYFDRQPEKGTGAGNSVPVEEFMPIGKAKVTKKIAFIDGGIQPIIESASLAVYFSRVYCGIYNGNSRAASRLFEFYIVIRTDAQERGISFKAELVHTQGEFSFPVLEFKSDDRALMVGENPVEMGAVGNCVRRLAELSVASQVKERGALIVMDGSLDCRLPFEKKFLDALRDSVAADSNSVAGISKTSGLRAGDGDSVYAILERSCPRKARWFLPASKLPLRADMPGTFFAKLHERSEHNFRIDFLSPEEGCEGMLSLIADNSTDPVFLGYPYGLIEADRLARVSNQEREQVRLMVFSSLGKDFSRLRPYLRSMDAHSILDAIR